MQLLNRVLSVRLLDLGLVSQYRQQALYAHDFAQPSRLPM
jgi:hypothetical protein